MLHDNHLLARKINLKGKNIKKIFIFVLRPSRLHSLRFSEDQLLSDMPCQMLSWSLVTETKIRPVLSGKLPEAVFFNHLSVRL